MLSMQFFSYDIYSNGSVPVCLMFHMFTLQNKYYYMYLFIT